MVLFLSAHTNNRSVDDCITYFCLLGKYHQNQEQQFIHVRLFSINVHIFIAFVAIVDKEAQKIATLLLKVKQREICLQSGHKIEHTQQQYTQ